MLLRSVLMWSRLVAVIGTSCAARLPYVGSFMSLTDFGLIPSSYFIPSSYPPNTLCHQLILFIFSFLILTSFIFPSSHSNTFVIHHCFSYFLLFLFFSFFYTISFPLASSHFFPVDLFSFPHTFLLLS